ncbi:1599_t:CDS:1, partial [Acaulospora morrowiae]
KNAETEATSSSIVKTTVPETTDSSSIIQNPKETTQEPRDKELWSDE